MKYLMKKLVRDIRDLWPQFVSVFMMAFLALAIYSGMEGAWFGLIHQADTYFENTCLADSWIYTQGASSVQVDQIAAIKGVTEAGGSMTVTADYNKDCDIRILTIGNQKVQNPMIISGLAFEEGEDGIWLAESFAKKHGVAVGDTISMEWNGRKMQAKVKGTVMDSEFIYYTTSATETVPDSYAHGYAFISEAQAKEWYGMLTYNEIRLNLEKDVTVSQVKDSVKDILGNKEIAFREREDLTSVYQVYKEAAQMKVLSRAYCTLFVLLSVLTMYTTMRRIIEKQRTITGTLKAIGFTNRTLLGHYAMYGVVISMLGCMGGCLFGKYVISRIIMGVKSKTLALPVWRSELSMVTALLSVGVVLVCTFSAIWAAYHSIREMPAETMRPESAVSTKSINRKRVSGRRLSNEWAWVMRDISRNKVRYLMGVIGIIGSMTLMMAGFGIKNSLDYSNACVYGGVYSYGYRISGTWDEASQQKLSDTGASVQWVSEGSGILESGKNSESGVISIVADGDYVSLQDEDRDQVSLPDEGAVISQKMADLLDVTKGDTITVTALFKTLKFEVKVVDIATVPAPQGIFMSEKAWENMGYPFEATSALVDRVEKGDWNSCDIVSLKEQKQEFSDFSKSLSVIFAMLITASLLLGFVILYNLGMLNFVERYREYATMKVIGFYLWEIRSMSYKDWLLTSIPGWLLGTAGGFCFLKFITGLVSLKSFVFFPKLGMPRYLLITTICLLGSFVVNLSVNRKVDSIDMAGALKSVE